MLISTTIALLVLAVISQGESTAKNVVFILADDLGYGDLGWAPFSSNEMKNLRTPNLQRMAKNGMILTNFHAASPICSPSRAAIMTGLFPWRMGVDFIYSQDPKKDGTEELDHEQLPLIPNIAMAFQHYNYYTAHIGKWHLGENISFWHLLICFLILDSIRWHFSIRYSKS